MLATRSLKPKLSLSVNIAPISTSAASTSTSTSTRPALSLNLSLRSPITPTPLAPLRSPMSPLPASPTARNTKLNQRGFSSFAQHHQALPSSSYSYSNSCTTTRGILKKSNTFPVAASLESNQPRTRVRQLAFIDKPEVYAISPVEEADRADYYGGYKKMSRDERRWTVRQ